MTSTSYRSEPVLRAALDDIIKAHGRWTVLKALLMRRNRAVSRVGLQLPLDDHLRRDIGLPPLAESGTTPVVPW